VPCQISTCNCSPAYLPSWQGMPGTDFKPGLMLWCAVAVGIGDEKAEWAAEGVKNMSVACRNSLTPAPTLKVGTWLCR
jgi:hypothetical protein